MNLKEMIKKDEGLRLKAYEDTEGHLTIGYGFNLENFDATDAEYFLNKKIIQATDWLNQFDWYKRLNEPRKAVCVNIVYNLGIKGFSAFKRMIRALEQDDMQGARMELWDSRAAYLLPKRYAKLGNMLKTGEWPESY